MKPPEQLRGAGSGRGCEGVSAPEEMTEKPQQETQLAGERHMPLLWTDLRRRPGLQKPWGDCPVSSVVRV